MFVYCALILQALFVRDNGACVCQCVKRFRIGHLIDGRSNTRPTDAQDSTSTVRVQYECLSIYRCAHSSNSSSIVSKPRRTTVGLSIAHYLYTFCALCVRVGWLLNEIHKRRLNRPVTRLNRLSLAKASGNQYRQLQVDSVLTQSSTHCQRHLCHSCCTCTLSALLSAAHDRHSL